MSDYKFNCPHCNQSLEAPEDMGGQTIECPACNGSIELPARAALPLSHGPRHQDPEPESDSDAATDRQIAYIRDLGGTVPPGLTKEKASEMIDALRNSAPPTQKQRDLVQKLGGTIPAGLTAAQASDFISELDGNQPPTRQQIRFIKMLGGDVPGTKREASAICETLTTTAPATAHQKKQAEELGVALPASCTFAQATKLLGDAEMDADPDEGKPPTRAQLNKIAKLGGDPQKAINCWRADEYIDELEEAAERFKDRIQETLDMIFGDPDTRSIMNVKKPSNSVLAKALLFGDSQGWGQGWENFSGDSDLNSYDLVDFAVYSVAPELLKQKAKPPTKPSGDVPAKPQAGPPAMRTQRGGVTKIVVRRATAGSSAAKSDTLGDRDSERPSPVCREPGGHQFMRILVILIIGIVLLFVVAQFM